MIDKERFREPEKCYRPEVRWWLAEGFHTDQTLKNDICMLDESGFGAVEFLAMGDGGVDSSRYGWGSEEWIHDSQLIIEETTKRGMGVSTTSGTNWANANLTTITPDDKAASKELDFVSVTLRPGERWQGKLPHCEITVPAVYEQELVAVLAGRIMGKKEKALVLDEANMIVLTGQVQNGMLDFTAPGDGGYELFFFWMHGTGQTAEPSVSVSYTVNYFDRYGVEAVIDYWSKEILTENVRENIHKNGRAMMYMDSLELNNWGKGAMFWGYHILEEFRGRRGYDITPYLPFLTKFHKDRGIDMMMPVWRYAMADHEKEWKIRNDMFQTWTELYMDNMLKPMQEWLHKQGMQLRAEISYGLPLEISQPGKYVDGVETESLEFASQIDSYRGLAGTAHIYNRPFSSETGANLYNYMLGLNFYTQIIFTQFAAGVSKTVLHGYSSIAGSDGGTYWPGHEGMLPAFAERFGSRQPASIHYQDWTAMIGRYQMIMRQGYPRVDLGIIRLDYFFNNMFMQYGPEKETYEEKFMRANEGLYWKDMSLQNNGYTYEYLAPQILEESFVDYDGTLLAAKGPGYKALILYQEGLPLASARKLYWLAQKGLPVILADGATETIHVNTDRFHNKAASRTPYYDGLDAELAEVMEEMEKLPNVKRVRYGEDILSVLYGLQVFPRVAFSKPNKKILTAYRQDADVDYLYVYHYMYTEKEPYRVSISADVLGKPFRVRCWEGRTEEIEYRKAGERTEVELELMPGEATVIAWEKDAEYLKKTECTYDSLIGFSQWKVMELDDWSLEIEDWNEGEKKEIVEDRGMGLITREVYFETKKTPINVGKTGLKPWKDIPEVGSSVSGVGRYTTEVIIPDEWDAEKRAVLKIGGTYGNTAAVYVNGQKAAGFDINRMALDISEHIMPGKNLLCIEVSSTLKNRLIERNYYEEHVFAMFRKHMEEEQEKDSGKSRKTEQKQEGPQMPVVTADDYGLKGPVIILLLEKGAEYDS